MNKRLTPEQIKKYNSLSNNIKDSITDVIIKESLNEQESYKLLLKVLRIT